MKTLIIVFLLVVNICPDAIALGSIESFRSRNMPGNFHIDDTTLSCRNGYEVYYGKTITVTWVAPPYDGGYVQGMGMGFQHYKLYVLRYGDTGENIIYDCIIPDRETIIFTIPYDFPTGHYAICIYAEYKEWYSPHWCASYAATALTLVNNNNVFVDRSPPEALIDPPWITGDEPQANDNPKYFTKGDDQGLVSISFNAPRDIGAMGNSDYASGIAGYYIYDGDTLIKIVDLKSQPNDLVTIDELSLTEGSHEISVAAFDNIYAIERDDPLTPTFPGIELPGLNRCAPSEIVVDQSGPDMSAVSAPVVSGTVSILGKSYLSRDSYVTWDKPPDLPQDEDDKYIGIGVKEYRVRIKNTNGNSMIIELPVEEAEGNRRFSFDPWGSIPGFNEFVQAGGQFTVSIIGKDGLGNPGEAGLESEPFYIDRTPPTTPEPDTPLIIEQPGAIILTTGLKIKVRLNPWLSDCTLNFKPSTDDDGTGISLYRAREVQDDETLWTRDFSSSEIYIGGLSNATNHVFKIIAVDRAGNESEPVTVIINPPLLPVTFPPEPVTLENGNYRLSWIAPSNADAIQFYKVIIKRRQGAAIDQAEFETRPTIAVTNYSLENAEQGVDLVAYVLAVDIDGSWSIGSREFRLEPLNAIVPRTLEGDETWSGEWALSQSVIVPSGRTLTIESGTIVRVKGNSGIYIRVENGGAIISDGTNSPIIIKSANTDPSTTDWKGIIINGGTAMIKDTEIRDAERGLTVLAQSAVSIEGGGLYHCRIGLHAGETLTVTEARFDGCEWYGVKEDAIADGQRPILTGCVFHENGYNYYHIDLLNITIDQLNGLDGNGDNSEEQ